jgi:hypothetical protein
MTTFPKPTGRRASRMRGDSVSAPLHHHFTIQCRVISGTWARLSTPGYAERAVWARSVAPNGLPLAGEDKWGWNRAYGSIPLFSFLLYPSPSSFALVFLHDLLSPSTAMAAELPPSRLKTTGTLASRRWLMGWQAPGLTCKVKSGATSLVNMRLGDFVFFMAYALAGLVSPLPSFFVTLLEYYRLQLQHLSPNFIALVAIFVHLCEMYVGVRPSVRLFRCFFVLKAASSRLPLISGHYFQRRTPGHARYIALVSPGRWERWREDWALMQTDVHDRLTLPVGGPTLDRTEWGKDPGLEPGFDPC